MSQNARNSKNNLSYNSKDGAKKKLLVAILTTFVALLVVIAIIVFSEIGMSIAIRFCYVNDSAKDFM